MTPAQRAAARTAHTEAVHDLKAEASGRGDDSDRDAVTRFVRHAEVLAGHLALALGLRDVARAREIVERANEVLANAGLDKRLVIAGDPDPFDGLAGNPAAVGASEPPPALHPTEGPTR